MHWCFSVMQTLAMKECPNVPLGHNIGPWSVWLPRWERPNTVAATEAQTRTQLLLYMLHKLVNGYSMWRRLSRLLRVSGCHGDAWLSWWSLIAMEENIWAKHSQWSTIKTCNIRSHSQFVPGVWHERACMCVHVRECVCACVYAYMHACRYGGWGSAICRILS